MDTYGVPVTGYLFGELNPRTLTALVYADLNGNGVFEYIESGITGQAVQLTGVSDRGVVYSLTVLTDIYGGAGFSGLPPGIYTLTETQPVTWGDGLDVATGSGVAGNDTVTGIAVTGTTQTGGATFGELVPGISGLVYIDANANGVYSSETGIVGVTVWMSGVTDAGAGVWLTTTSDAQGRFFFNSPLTGTYTLSEQQPAQYLDGFEQVGPGGGITGAISVDTITGIVYTPTTAEGRPVAAMGNTFAEVTPSSIEGFTFIDSDNSQYLSLLRLVPGQLRRADLRGYDRYHRGQ